MLSRSAYILSVIVLCYSSFFFYPRWNKSATEATISWDVSGYYWYLPATFIYKDLKKIAFKDSILQKYQPTFTEPQQSMPLDNGNFVMKYSSGMAFMYMPFFAVSHISAGILGYPQDGFSVPYQIGIQIAGLLIGLLGLWYFRKFLLLFYSDKVVAITIFLLVIGTNYLNYASIDVGMSHTWLFTLYVFILLNTYYFYQSFSYKHALRIGLLVGLATLTRPTEIVSLIIPLLWGLDTLSLYAIKTHLKNIIQHFKKMILAVVAASAVIFIQLVYWKYVSGHWLVYSYGGQTFSWLHPHAILYSFNYRCGWLTYCPLMILALIGFLPFAKYGKHKVAIIVFSLVSYYLVSAWDVWWYGGRAMVQSYAVLCIPLAALVHYVSNKKILSVVFTVLAAFFIYLNIWVVVQYHNGGLYDSESMSKAYYWRVIGKWRAPSSTKKLLDAPDLYEGTPQNIKLLYSNNFDTCSAINCFTDSIKGGKNLLLNKQFYHIKSLKINYSNPKPGTWLRATATFYSPDPETYTWHSPMLSLRVDNNDIYVKENRLRTSRFLKSGEKSTLFVDLKLTSNDVSHVYLYVWNKFSNKNLIVDDLKIEEFTEK